jgi:hypothetical protein
LTRDDVGGLSYLLSTNNINYETLLPGIVASGANPNAVVNGAWRPGVDKITFMPQQVNPVSGNYLSLTNQFTDIYRTNASFYQQQLVRVISQPDFLFSAGDVVPDSIGLPFFRRTGTTNWLNNSVANGNTNGTGPGIIRPQVRIVFNKLGLTPFTYGYPSDETVRFDVSAFWSTFDISTNTPFNYPISRSGTNELMVRMWLANGKYPTWITRRFEWKAFSTPGAQFVFQTSTNLAGWINLFTVTNNSSVCTYFNQFPTSQSRYYRLVAQ